MPANKGMSSMLTFLYASLDATFIVEASVAAAMATGSANGCSGFQVSGSRRAAT
jgi:hypothetical protein